MNYCSVHWFNIIPARAYIKVENCTNRRTHKSLQPYLTKAVIAKNELRTGGKM